MSSSKFVSGENLARISAKRLRNFLLGVVNSNGAAGDAIWFRRQFSDFFPGEWLSWAVGLPGALTEPEFWEVMLLIQRDHLRAVWNSPDTRTAEWRTFTLRYREHDNMPPPLQRNRDMELPAAVPLQQALTYLEQNVDLLRRCGNPDCKTMPYFFAERRSQKYCSEPCALPAQKAAKLRWWNKHGEAHRKSLSKGRSKNFPEAAGGRHESITNLDARQR